MRFKKINAIRCALRGAAAAAGRYWLIGEGHVLRGVRYAGRMTLAGSRRCGPWLARATDKAAPYAVKAWNAAAWACSAAVTRLRPPLAWFWRWCEPARVKGGTAAVTVFDQLAQAGEVNRWESVLLEEQIDSPAVRAVVRTRSRVDVGMWCRKGRLWACATPGGLVLLAHGVRPYVERIAYDRIDQSRYNHVTAELVFAPDEDLAVKKLRVTPLEALELLKRVPRLEVAQVA